MNDNSHLIKTFYSHGKLLLMAEYLILDGAKALAIPTKRGQKLEIKKNQTQNLHWRSILEDGSIWIDAYFSLSLDDMNANGDPILKRLLEILRAAQELNPSFLSDNQGYDIVSTLEFPQNWGLGSSSTLIANIARWAEVNPYILLEKTFGGSGYDIACADASQAITFQKDGTAPIVSEVSFAPAFEKDLFFVYLNKKQNSRESIQHYRSLDPETLRNETIIFSKFTEGLLNAIYLHDFEKILQEHEKRLSRILKTPTIKSRLFCDYPRTIKSLGGWGGDFVLVTGSSDEIDYFRKKGYKTIIPYKEMIL